MRELELLGIVFGAAPLRDAAVVGLQATTTVAQATQIYLRYHGEIATSAFGLQTVRPFIAAHFNGGAAQITQASMGEDA